MHDRSSVQGCEWLVAGGECAALARATDWAATPLGAPAAWPTTLRTVASICLSNLHPMTVLWGAELVMLYNDGYRPLLGALKHPRAMGQRVRDCWSEIWPDIGPLLERVVATGEAVWREDQYLRMLRNGYPEECYFTFAFSPILDDTGRVAGVLVTVTETTERILGERRLRTLHELGQRPAGATLEDASAWLTRALASDPADLPFALLFLVESGTARCVVRAGVVPPGAEAAAALRATDALAVGEPARVELPGGPADARDTDGSAVPRGVAALVIPITGDVPPAAGAVLVAGVSGERPRDDEYRRFLELVGHHVGEVLTAARMHEAERQRAELAQRVREQEMLLPLLRVSQTLNSTLDVDRLLDALVHEALRLTGAGGGCAGLRTADGMRTRKYVRGDGEVALHHTWAPGDGLPGWILVHRAPYVTNDAAADGQIVPELRDAFEVRCAASTPILDSRGEVLGFFEIHNKPGGFADADRALLVGMSRIASIAVQNALAYAEVQRTRDVLRRQALVFETISEAVVVTDRAGRLLDWNPAAERLTGCLREEVPAGSVAELIAAGIAPRRLRQIVAVIEREGVWTGELRLQPPDGHPCSVEATVVALRDGEGRPYGYVGVARDVTARRRAEDALRTGSAQRDIILELQREAATAALNVDAVARRIVERTQRLIHADGAVLHLLEGDALVANVGAGIGERLVGRRFATDAAVAAQPGGDGRDGHDVLAAASETVRAAARAAGIHSLVVVPLVYDGRPLGLLHVCSRQARAADENDVHALQLAAGVLSAAIAHALEFRRKQQLLAERTTALAALSESEERFRSLSACSPVGIFTTDDAGRLTYVNSTIQTLSGHPATTALGEGWTTFVHPEDRERVLADWWRAFETGSGADFVTRIVHPSRGVRWVRVRTAPLRLDGDVGAGHVGTVADITEQREMEEAVRRAELQYRELVEMAQAVVWRGVGEIPRFTFVNGRAAELSGFPVERWTAEPGFWLDRTLPEDRPAVLHALERARGGPQEVATRMRDARDRVVSLRGFVRYVGETTAGPEFIGMLFDETALRQARDEAEASRERLRELAERLQSVREQEQARIAREIHDELGQLLTGLKLQLAWHAGRLPDDAAELVVSAGDMLALVDETIATVRRIALRLRPGVLDDLGLLAALEWLAHDFERRTGVPCRLSLPESPCAVAETHATPLFRIAQEALTNVARHADAHSVEVALRNEAGQCVLTVRDDGRGMPPELARERQSLGLLGMRERAIATGGDMVIGSRSGQGTTVTARVGRRDAGVAGGVP